MFTRWCLATRDRKTDQNTNGVVSAIADIIHVTYFSLLTAEPPSAIYSSANLTLLPK